MIAAIGAVCELRRMKPRVVSETGNPVSVKKGVELLGGIPSPQVIKVVLPYSIVRGVLHFKERKHEFASRLQRAERIENVEEGFSRIEVSEYRPVKHNIDRSVGCDDLWSLIQNRCITWALPAQLIKQFANNVCACVSALPSGALQRLRGAPAATAEIINSHSIN